MERTLAGHLAQTGWITRHAEPLSTVGLAYLLEDPTLSAAIANLLCTRAHLPLPSGLKWEAEAIQIDGGRPDLEGTHDGLPVVKIEAKYGAVLSAAQLRSYERDQARRLAAAGTAAILTVLVPTERLGDARNLLNKAYPERTDTWWFITPKQHAIVASWDEVLDALELTSPVGATACDLRQLRGMVMALGGLGVPPLSLADLGPEWEIRRRDYESIVDRLTRILTPGPLMPFGTESTGYRRRYVLVSENSAPYYSIGLRPPPPGATETPVWLRFHSKTPGFGQVRAALSRSNLSRALVEEGGHIWYGLKPPIEVGGSALIADLAAQVHLLLAAAGLGQAGASS